uniref:Uncharacterized protein n=1 Tax=Trypanosoma congolense (strain IL3000) TaxID=1068625 RepID=G0UXQ8_TRYCI|nr:conserved hypothetical protein [Trypanosoma congolense IL3000]
MRYSGLQNALPVALPQYNCAWYSALEYYWRSLVECGSHVGPEHSYRISLLYLNNGKQKQLCNWVRLFSFEDVPVCGLMLKALIKRDMWQSALEIWSWGADGALCDAVVDELMAKSMWTQSLQAVCHLLNATDHNDSCGTLNSIPLEEPIISGEEFPVISDKAMWLSSKVSFLPEEYRKPGGLSHLVNGLYPKNSQWQQAVCLLVKLSVSGTSVRTRKELLEVAAARCTYSGARYKYVFEWVTRCNYLYSSCSLNRTFLRVAISLSLWEDAFAALRWLTDRGLEEVTSFTVDRLCRKFMKEYEQGKDLHLINSFSSTLSKCVRLLPGRTKDELKVFLLHNAIDVSVLDIVAALDSSFETGVTPSEMHFLKNGTMSVMDIDKTGTLALSRGQWKTTLILVNMLIETKPLTDKEKFIVNAVRESSRNWETALLFFT